MNKQEKLWASGFGTEYHKRNQFESRDQFWLDVLKEDVLKNSWSVLELGAGKGENLEAIHNLRTNLFDIRMCVDQLTGVDVNAVACKEMERRGFTAINKPVLEADLDKQFELVITRGFLIHVPKGALPSTLACIYNASSRYICFAEYYSPVRREVDYHGQGSALWLDDFAARIMEMYPSLKLLDYGFKYHKDNGYDLTYFLMEK
ncbi:MAG: methyltransferase domain-containing protein [Chitinophagaceae bacterium]|nr:MAG: methyltransferase domain-containing protein [Chitinophagaceae bacterium]